MKALLSALAFFAWAMLAVTLFGAVLLVLSIGAIYLAVELFSIFGITVV